MGTSSRSWLQGLLQDLGQGLLLDLSRKGLLLDLSRLRRQSLLQWCILQGLLQSLRSRPQCLAETGSTMTCFRCPISALKHT